MPWVGGSRDGMENVKTEETRQDDVLDRQGGSSLNCRGRRVTRRSVNTAQTLSFAKTGDCPSLRGSSEDEPGRDTQ